MCLCLDTGMSLRLLKSRPKPNITSRRKPLNGENHEVSKPPEVQLSKNEEEIKVLLEASTNKISNSDQSIPSKGKPHECYCLSSFSSIIM